MMPRVLPPKLAKEGGYHSMTQPYLLPEESWMLANVVADMKRTGADFILVETANEAVEVWRK